MCTSGPDMLRRRLVAVSASEVVGRRRASALAQAGRARRRGRRPRRRRASSRALCSSEAEQTSRVARPAARSAAHRLERLDVAEVVAGEQERRRRRAPRPAAGRPGPCPCPAARTSITLRPGSTTRSWRRGQRRVSAGSSRSNAAVGVVEPPGVYGDGQALLLDVRVRGVGPAQHAGQVAQERRQSPCGGRGRDHPALGGGPALVAVLAEDVAAPGRRRRSRRRPRRARRARAPGGPGRPVITAMARDLRRPGRPARRAASGWMCASLGVVDDRGQGAVEVEPDDGRRGGARRGRRTAASPSAERELHEPTQSTAERSGRRGASGVGRR